MRAIGVDVGTTVVKAVGYDDGAERVVRRQGVPVARPRPGWAEQDMAAVWEAVAGTVAGVREELGTPDLLAVTGQGDGAWLVDADGAPTGPAPLWNDGRAGDLLTAWAQDGTAETFAGLTGSWPSTGMAGPLLAWFRDHDSDRLRRSARVLGCSGWVFSRLTGETVTDPSGAATLLDQRRGTYSEELLATLSLGDLAGLLPDLRADDDRAAGLRRVVADELGLPEGLPVVLAPYDICATAVGAGAVAPGEAVCILGTTLCPEMVLDRVPGAVETGITVGLGAPGRWLRAFPTMAGGDVLEWATRTLGAADVGALLAMAADSEPGAHGVRFLPYLSPAGERNPFTDTAARGSLHGLSLETGPADLARAVVEGLTMTIRDCLAVAADEGVAPESLALCGGGAASPAWSQLIAEMTGVPVRRSADAEVGARGAVLVGEVAVGAAPDLAAAVAGLLPRGEPLVPDPAAVAAYDGAREAFVGLREQVRPTWRVAPRDRS